jgi:hypothetical protein
MKILVIGGIHGNERLGVDLVTSLEQNPIENIDTLIANPLAVAQNVRFVESDLNRSFGTSVLDTYEKNRAKELEQIIKPYDIVLDFHNTQTPNNNCCFIGLECSPILYEVIKRMQFDVCIEATYDCINKYAPNTISVEISIGDTRDSVQYWRSALQQLVTKQTDEPSTRQLTIYRYEQRVTWQQQETFELFGWQPFKELSVGAKRQLGVRGKVVPIFIGSKLTEYYATLLKRVKLV